MGAVNVWEWFVFWYIFKYETNILKNSRFLIFICLLIKSRALTELTNIGFIVFKNVNIDAL